MEQHQIIAISGQSGCGNTTVSRIVADTLGYTLINYTMRNLAIDLGLSMEELLIKAKSDTSYDMMLDKRQKEMALKNNSVVGSRLAIWLIKEATIKVYLYANIETRARRIQSRELNSDFKKTLTSTQARDTADHERFYQLYSIDNTKYEFADIIINTELYTPNQIADIIVTAYKVKIA